MRIDLSLYDGSKEFVITWFHTKGGEQINYTVSMMAAVAHVPCIVIAYWLGVETNWHPDSIACIKRLIDFYGYDSIENKPPNAPI